jgi:CDP-diacylglycerol--glycerol-3-phosphate 3-phosphatidyltransferase
MKLRDLLQQIIYKILNPFVKLLIKIGFTPNVVTTIGLLINIAATIVLLIGAEKGAKGDLSYIGWFSGLLLFAGIFDMLDGQVARIGNMASTFGALYDSVLDRYSELIMFLGICYFLVAQNYLISSLIAFLALVGSMMVSYVRARAEGLGIECKKGLMQRPERIVIIGVSGLITGIVSSSSGGNQKIDLNWIKLEFLETISIFIIPLAIVAILSNYTAFQRLKYCQAKLTEKQISNVQKRA